MKNPLNQYSDPQALFKQVEAGNHRQIIGGLWDELGSLQLDVLKSQGMKPHHLLLDIGCGCLRGGTKFADYLDSNNYYGIDLSKDLIEAGYERELTAEVRKKLPRSNLVVTGDFDIPFEVGFDYVIAQSVFTHLPLNDLKHCLFKLQKAMKPGAGFFVSFFHAPDLQSWAGALHHTPGGITSFPAINPFHYLESQIKDCATGLSFEFELVGDWGHPRNQMLAKFVKTAPAAERPVEIRALSRKESMGLPPGADHYRAFVGPPKRFDFMSATQFALLFSLGLGETDSVLDIGCGSLRLGRLLIPYLQEGRYCGVDPNSWLIDDGVDQELGRDAISLKKPIFSSREDFNFAEFDRHFEFMIAQSIATHTGPDQLRAMLEGAAAYLEPNGLFLFSYIESKNGSATPDDGWHYPNCTSYSEEYMIRTAADAGLSAVGIPWFHPGAKWMIAAVDPLRLPAEEDLDGLHGRVLNDS